MEAVTDSKPRVCFEFEVEKVIGVSNDGNFQVQWAPAWVSKFHLVGCEHLIEEFLQEQSESEIEINSELEIDKQDVVSDPSLKSPCTDQTSVRGSTVKVEVGEETNNIDIDPFRISTSLPYRANSTGTTWNDGSTSTNMELEQEQEFSSQHHERESEAENETDEPNLSNEIEDDLRSSDICHQEHIDQRLLSQSTVKIEVFEEPTHLRTDRLTTTTDLVPLPLASSSGKIFDETSVTVDGPVEYHQSNESESSEGISTSLEDAPWNQQECTAIVTDNNDMSTLTDSSTKYQCYICKKLLFSHDNLQDHLQSSHQRYLLVTKSSEKTLQCTQCGKKFTHVSALSRHTRAHKENRTYPCMFCKKKFNRKDNLMRHVRGHIEYHNFSI